MIAEKLDAMVKLGLASSRMSLGLVQRVFNILVLKGLLQVEGVRTAKTFSFNKPKELLESCLEHYSIVKKCKIRTYRSALSGKSECFKALKKYGLGADVILALHSAAEEIGLKNTKLEGLELYIFDSSMRAKLESALQLEPQERGYAVLLIEPYYKMLLKKNRKDNKEIGIFCIFGSLSFSSTWTRTSGIYSSASLRTETHLKKP